MCTRGRVIAQLHVCLDVCTCVGICAYVLSMIQGLSTGGAREPYYQAIRYHPKDPEAGVEAQKAMPEGIMQDSVSGPLGRP